MQVFQMGALKMVDSTISRALTDLDRDIEVAIRNVPPVQRTRPDDAVLSRESAPDLAMPEYVEHHDGASEIGKLSAEAVVREFEAAAKEIETMGAELIERVQQCEAMTRDAFAVSEELKQTAARYREEAKRIFVQIENCSLVMAEVRTTCAELRDKIAIPAPADVPKPKKK
jgi:hypothetical protein